MGNPKVAIHHPPPTPPPQAIPTTDENTGDFAMKEELKKSGYAKTILTGNLVPKSTGKKTTLG
jgi:hypothetical protein